MSHKHFVIIVVGLGDEGNTLRFATQHFRRRGLTPIVHLIGWRDKEKEFHPKLDRLLHRIDALAKNG
ncbi:MAG: hypothetical protein NTY06_03945, partial [Candidatus Gottesmanbacteria bacterium]|nr:hypothetical protein [Candidatus Gottesmanbacteria bacterium]